MQLAADPYARRREAASARREETRRRLLAAADQLFREDGYQATTVVGIAARAGVSLQTLYLAWGSKRALFRAAAAVAAVAAPLPVEPDEWRSQIRAQLRQQAGVNASAPAYLAAVSRVFAPVAERTALYWRMHRQAMASDPELATDWDALKADRRRTMEEVAAGVPERGLRAGLTPEAVADTVWTLASHETYDLLVTERGLTVAAYTSWLERTLTAALCPD